MKINNEKLINLAVETQSGDVLGKVENYNVDVDTQSILEYNIKPSGLVKGLVAQDLIISRGQVIEITDKKMIVEDLSFKNKNKAKQKNKQEATQGVIMKER